jgi:hypothetical protein
MSVRRFIRVYLVVYDHMATVTPIPHKFPLDATQYSITGWKPDLALFDAVSKEEEQVARSPARISTCIAACPNTYARAWLAKASD